LSLSDWILPGLGHMALLIVRDIIKGYTVILLIIVLGIIANDATEAIPSYTFTILSNIIILIIPKVLYNIIATIK